MPERKPLLALFPHGDDFFKFPFPNQRNKYQIVGIGQLVGDVGGEDGDALLCGHHHQDAFDVIGAEQDVGVITGLLVKLHEMIISEGIGGAGRGHIKNGLILQLFSPKGGASGKWMASKQGHHQRRMVNRAVFYVALLHNIGAVPGEDDIVIPDEKAGGQLIRVAPVAGNQDIRILQMEGPEVVGKAAPRNKRTEKSGTEESRRKGSKKESRGRKRGIADNQRCRRLHSWNRPVF